MNVLSLFAGIGGLDLGLERAGMTVVGQVEIDPFCQRVLAKHWPEVPRHDDVRTAGQWWTKGQPRPAVDVVAGGYPCQPDSLAGRRLGQGDPRWLWPAMAEVIDALRPAVVIGENVLGHRTRGLRIVLDDLARLGYRARAGTIRACEVGAPHSRARLFVVAHTDSGDGPVGLGTGARVPVPAGGRDSCAWPDPEHGPMAVAARGVRVANGAASRMDGRRVRAVGNAVVPQVAEYIGRIVTGAAA